MDGKTKEYYTLCVEFLKLSEVYKEVISQVDNASNTQHLVVGFEKLDFSKDVYVHYWLRWLSRNKISFTDDIFITYHDLLYLAYPIFQDVHNQNIKLILERIEHAQDSKRSIHYQHVSCGNEYVKKLLNSYLDACSNKYPNLSVKDFVRRFIDMKLNNNFDRIIDLESEVIDDKDDGYSYLVKIDARGKKNDIINEFRKYQTDYSAKESSVYPHWEEFKRFRSFAFMPDRFKNAASKWKLLNILKDKQANGLSYSKINEKYKLKNPASNQAKEYVRRAKKIILNIENKCDFMLNDPVEKNIN